MTLEEIESMELTYELIEQAQQEATLENFERIILLTARMLLDYCDGDREMAKEQVQRDYEGQTPIHGADPNLLRLLLKSIDALADFRAKKAPVTPGKELTDAPDTTGTGCYTKYSTESGGKQGEV